MHRIQEANLLIGHWREMLCHPVDKVLQDLFKLHYLREKGYLVRKIIYKNPFK